MGDSAQALMSIQSIAAPRESIRSRPKHIRTNLLRWLIGYSDKGNVVSMPVMKEKSSHRPKATFPGVFNGLVVKSLTNSGIQDNPAGMKAMGAEFQKL